MCHLLIQKNDARIVSRRSTLHASPLFSHENEEEEEVDEVTEEDEENEGVSI